MREMSFWQRLRYTLVRKSFSGPYRVQFYDALRFLIENRQQLKPSLEKMRNAWTNFGQHWHPYAELTDDCIEALRENSGEQTLERTLSRWLPAAEASVIGAGIRSESLPRALKFASRLTGAGKRIRASVWQMAIYPVGFAILMVSTLYVLNTELLPTLLEISPPESWTGALGLLYGISEFFREYGLFTGGLVIALVIWVVWSIPRWHRPDRLRRAFDTLMPWSVYKDMQGSTFLLNVGALLQSGVKTLDALDILQETASPWLAVRIEAITEHVREGKHFGLALKDCGYDFPSREAANFLSLLQGDGEDDIISNYGQRWLEQTLERVAKRAVLVRGFMFLAMILMLMLLVLVVTDINALNNTSGVY
ncbi:type II secretion system F family protein [Leclercia adecarboxylata]|uniref:IncI1 plasmid conjugative transfer inner membrane protein PilR n=1 Tax=Leclercia adecarboxylata TaxID=83655 RepID=A0A482M1Q6_9ENTR|nr:MULTISPECIES: type II secretion system F family protein [Enterobacteriaceae]MBZ3802751.1 type II secretion system F family protein [Leclercia adecarboxylata]MBZ3807244.1 type II secretion system F family protein [Leclercia adecarboxylata]MDC6624228.1 type II secretion system F family protein [Leclercia adecarboxylata]MDC6635137.1 type II secretion system F family protein [Leclercia adecarboxylata]MDC6640765.1 type II secretion system F family protein [Leclercia adecarboxylata]